MTSGESAFLNMAKKYFELINTGFDPGNVVPDELVYQKDMTISNLALEEYRKLKDAKQPPPGKGPYRFIGYLINENPMPGRTPPPWKEMIYLADQLEHHYKILMEMEGEAMLRDPWHSSLEAIGEIPMMIRKVVLS